MGLGERGGEGGKSCDGEKAWSSINHSRFNTLCSRLSRCPPSEQMNPLGVGGGGLRGEEIAYIIVNAVPFLKSPFFAPNLCTIHRNNLFS